VAGSGGCNRYTGKGALARGKAAIGPLASTRMACPPALMNQETRFLAALARAARYEILPGGLMAILDARGAAILRLSRM
jgi:putative lipoprotein